MEIYISQQEIYHIYHISGSTVQHTEHIYLLIHIVVSICESWELNEELKK